jgi:hypothetical protein
VISRANLERIRLLLGRIMRLAFVVIGVVWAVVMLLAMIFGAIDGDWTTVWHAGALTVGVAFFVWLYP